MSEIESIIQEKGFRIRHQVFERAKEEDSKSYNDLDLSETSLNFLLNSDIKTLWSHQHEAIKLAKNGHNVCVTTSTSSGKTQIFQIAAMEILSQRPGSKVLAIYPMKALSSQQVDRWKRSGLNIGIIDGDHKGTDYRREQLQNSDVLVMTPDVVHSFLLGRLNDTRLGRTIHDFISKISLIIIDELHLYKGYFGTNSAYLFRRLNNVRRLILGLKAGECNALPLYITASATLPNAPEHSFNITGVKDFIEIGIDKDGSPAGSKHFFYIENDTDDGSGKNRNTKIKDLVYAIANELPESKSITFVESRQTTGRMAFDDVNTRAEATGIFPYRSGYEDKEREIIQHHLEDGDFKGVIATSALEIGIDIDGLNVAIIADMPHDKNSYQQRIGRVGRYGCEGDSYVIIVRDENSFASNILFSDQSFDMDIALPDYEPALYIEDSNIQYIHALCHIGNSDECECKEWIQNVGRQRSFNDGGCFPQSFTDLCNNILSSNMPKAYEEKEEETNSPHFDYAIRSFGDQYQICDIKTREQIDKEISRQQVASEAYRGAVRNTVSEHDGIIERRHRVRNIDFRVRPKQILVSEERNRLITKTTPYKRTFLIPNFANINISINCGQVSIHNMRTYEHINIWGYYEHFLNGRRDYNRYDRVLQIPRFTTTGTLIFHPSFNNPGVHVDQIAQVVFETFLRRNAFDRNDISYIGGRLFTGNNKYPANTKFVALYDASPLNLSRSLMEDYKINDLFEYLGQHLHVISQSVVADMNEQTESSIRMLCQDIINNESIVDAPEITERKYKGGTPVCYLKRDDNNPEDEERIERKTAIYIGVGDTDLSVNLFVDGQIIYNVSINDTENVENTEYI